MLLLNVCLDMHPLVHFFLHGAASLPLEAKKNCMVMNRTVILLFTLDFVGFGQHHNPCDDKISSE
jgi:hypothetical protein